MGCPARNRRHGPPHPDLSGEVHRPGPDHELRSADLPVLRILWAPSSGLRRADGWIRGDGPPQPRRGDRHRPSARLLARLANPAHACAAHPRAAPAAAIAASPLAGWELITPEYLANLAPLTSEETVRYFDGAVPTWRHAVSSQIPRLSHVAELCARIGGARAARGAPMLQLLRAAGGE